MRIGYCKRGVRFLGATLLMGFAHTTLAFEVIHGGTFDVNGDDPFFSGVVDYYDYFGAYAPLPELKGGASARVRTFIQRQGRLREGDGSVIVNESDPDILESDFPGISTTTPGKAISMGSNFGLVPAGISAAGAQAKGDYFANHARAASAVGFYFYNDQNRDEINDDGDLSNDYYLRSSKHAFAGASWTDYWQATQNESISINFSLDGSVYNTNPCPGGMCGVTLPLGTNSFKSLQREFRFEATMVVFDLSTLMPCEFVSNACDGEADAPITIRSIKVRGGNLFEDDLAAVQGGGTLSIDLTDSFDFDVISGHAYYAIGEIIVAAENGTVVDFSNTFRLTSIEAQPGTIISDLVENQGAQLNIVSAVPVPGAVWMLLGGVGALAARGRVVRRLS